MFHGLLWLGQWWLGWRIFRHGMVSGIRGESVLFQEMGMEFEDKTVLESCRKVYCEYGPAAGVLCWVYDGLGELYLARSCTLMGSKAGSCTGNL